MTTVWASVCFFSTLGYRDCSLCFLSLKSLLPHNYYFFLLFVSTLLIESSKFAVTSGGMAFKKHLLYTHSNLDHQRTKEHLPKMRLRMKIHNFAGYQNSIEILILLYDNPSNTDLPFHIPKGVNSFFFLIFFWRNNFILSLSLPVLTHNKLNPVSFFLSRIWLWSLLLLFHICKAKSLLSF